MATFRLAGYKITQNADQAHPSVAPAELAIISSPVDGQFRFSYLSDDLDEVAIKLVDHNLTIDGIHIHDRPAHVTFELTDASWAYGETSRVFTLRYEDGGPDFVFGFGPDEMPDLTTPEGQAEMSYHYKETRVPTLASDGEIDLAGIPGIQIEGTYVPTPVKPLTLTQVMEAFDFLTADHAEMGAENEFAFLADEMAAQSNQPEPKPLDPLEAFKNADLSEFTSDPDHISHDDGL